MRPRMRFLAKSWILYPIVALAAVGLVTLSLGGRWTDEITPLPQAGSVRDGLVIFAGEALSAPETPEAVDSVHIVREGATVTGLRIASQAGLEEPTPADRGVRILLAPETAERFTGKAVLVQVDVRSIGETTAQRLAVSLQDFGPVEWRSAPLTTLPGTLEFTLPASVLGMPPEAIGLRTVSADRAYNFGVEITEIRLRPV